MFCLCNSIAELVKIPNAELAVGTKENRRISARHRFQRCIEHIQKVMPCKYREDFV